MEEVSLLGFLSLSLLFGVMRSEEILGIYYPGWGVRGEGRGMLKFSHLCYN